MTGTLVRVAGIAFSWCLFILLIFSEEAPLYTDHAQAVAWAALAIVGAFAAGLWALGRRQCSKVLLAGVAVGVAVMVGWFTLVLLSLGGS